MSSGPSQPPGYSGLTPDQIAMVNQTGYAMSPNAIMPNAPNGQPQQLQQPPGYSNLNPSQIQAVNQQGFYTSPDAVQPQSLWQKMMGALGSMPRQGGAPSMPGTTIGQPSGAAQMGATPRPPLSQGQMPTPRGIPALQQPAAGGAGNNGLMAQYMALQQLMRGA